MTISSTAAARSKPTASSIICQINKNTSRKEQGKSNNHVRFTNPLVSDVKIFHSQYLSFYEKQKLFYGENDIKRFQYEYYSENERIDMNAKNNSMTLKQIICTVTTIMAWVFIVTYLFKSKVLRPLVRKLKDVSAILLSKDQTTLLEDHSSAHQRNIPIVFVESKNLFCDSL